MEADYVYSGYYLGTTIYYQLYSINVGAEFYLVQFASLFAQMNEV